MKKGRGFTLIEMLVVIIVIGILAAIPRAYQKRKGSKSQDVVKDETFARYPIVVQNHLELLKHWGPNRISLNPADRQISSDRAEASKKALADIAARVGFDPKAINILSYANGNAVINGGLVLLDKMNQAGILQNDDTWINLPRPEFTPAGTKTPVHRNFFASAFV